MNRLSPLSRWTILLPGILLLSGCGDGRPVRVPVSGQVLLDGKPVPLGFIRLLNDGGRPAQGTLDSEGRFRLTTYDDGDGCVPGTHPVEVLAAQRLGARQVRLLVPKKYFSAATSGLTVTVDGATDSLRIDLVSNGQKPIVETSETGGDVAPKMEPAK